MGKRIYFRYDGRAASGNTDDALVLDVGTTLEQIAPSKSAYPDSVVYSYLDDGVKLVDERLEVEL